MMNWIIGKRPQLGNATCRVANPSSNPRRLGVHWEYSLTPEAVRQLKQLGPSVAAEVKGYLEERIRGATNPRQFGKPLRGELHGLWRYRVRDWRLLCRLDDNVLTVVLVTVVHRSEAFD